MDVIELIPIEVTVPNPVLSPEKIPAPTVIIEVFPTPVITDEPPPTD